LVDVERIGSRLDRLEHLIELLDEVRAGGVGAYVRDERLRAMTERLQLAIQKCIDLGAQLVSELSVEPPADYAGVFRSLAHGGYLEPDLGELSSPLRASETSSSTRTSRSTITRCSPPLAASTTCAGSPQ